MKRILYIFLALALVLAMTVTLSGCGAAGDGILAADVTVGGYTPAEIVADFIAAALRLLLLAILLLFTKIVFPFISNTVIPYLDEKHLMNIIRVFVRSAEKQGETGAIEKAKKKEYVIGLLEKRGIPITPTVLEMIEAAVEELDKLGDQFMGLLPAVEAAQGTEEQNLEPEMGPE